MLRRTGFISVLLAVFALLAFAVAPASAHHKDGHENGRGSSEKSDHDGDADSDSGTSYTEDNDTNDGNTPNNVEDDGDNQHPSGKDRSVENGGSGNQGNSESDPDDDGHGPDRSNGGPDKPNGSGGDDLADQDGNNGCGNDDDFEDDNEGWCGKPKDDDTVLAADEDKDDKVCPEAKVMGEQSAAGCGDDVLGSILNKSGPAGRAGKSGDVVLGASLSAPVSPAAPAVGAATAAAPGEVLPFTGAGLVPFAAFGLALIGAGSALVARKRW